MALMKDGPALLHRLIRAGVPGSVKSVVKFFVFIVLRFDARRSPSIKNAYGLPIRPAPTARMAYLRIAQHATRTNRLRRAAGRLEEGAGWLYWMDAFGGIVSHAVDQFADRSHFQLVAC